MHLALYQPDIPQNTGTILRMAACLWVPVHIIEPAGFNTGDRAMRRAGLDYLDLVDLTRHSSFDTFLRERPPGRPVLLTTRAHAGYTDLSFMAGDILLLGRESAGVPDHVHDAVDERARIPMRAETRWLNVAVAAAIVVGEALRQTGGLPPRESAMQPY